MDNNNIKKWIAVLTTGLMLILPVSLLASDASEEKTNHIPMEDVQRFSDAVNLIKKYYVKPVNDKDLFNNAIRGMLSGLDPHSGFLDIDELSELQATTSGEFGGLGIEVTMEEGLIKVITPLVDSPAFKAGVKSGDFIIKLGTQSVEGLTLKDAVNLMRGPVGSTIELTILRKGANKPLFFSLIREKILIKSVKSRLLDGHYGYIRITQFQASTAHDMELAITALKQQAGGNLSGLILDLRNNPGGLLDSAIQVADDFLDNNNNTKGTQELIVYTQGRLPGSEFRAKANGNDLIKGSPIIVLINNGSASASEIVAGALKDNKRAIILGTRSFGKGSVQTVLPLDEKRAIKLTTALYFTPAGISIQAKGITPDIIVEEITLDKSSKKSRGFDYSESGLRGHLTNGNGSNKIEAQNNQDDEKLMHEDYQLYAALTVLKGLAVAKK